MGGEARRSVLFALPLIAIRGKSVVLMMGYLRFELPFFVHFRKKSRQKSVKANEFFFSSCHHVWPAIAFFNQLLLGF
jgi:hypothetical protein